MIGLWQYGDFGSFQERTESEGEGRKEEGQERERERVIDECLDALRRGRRNLFFCKYFSGWMTTFSSGYNSPLYQFVGVIYKA